ncbi:MAG: hypothetical protein OXU26_15275, partial [Acidobacteriota bacterium]|nr:hypothetical protein [Acidobacteriota bacterium]
DGRWSHLSGGAMGWVPVVSYRGGEVFSSSLSHRAEHPRGIPRSNNDGAVRHPEIFRGLSGLSSGVCVLPTHASPVSDCRAIPYPLPALLGRFFLLSQNDIVPIQDGIEVRLGFGD